MRIGCPGVVGVLQPRPALRALGRARVHGCRSSRNSADPPPVDCGGNDGDDVQVLRHPGPLPSAGRLGGDQPPPHWRSQTRRAGRGHPGSLRVLGVGADRGHHRQWSFATRLALGEDSRAAAIGSYRRRTRSEPNTCPNRNPSSGDRKDSQAEIPRRRYGAHCRQSGDSPGDSPIPSRRIANRGRLARLSRTSSRRHRHRRTHQDRLGFIAAGPTVAPAGGTGLVVLRGRRRPRLHAGAAR